MLSDNRGKAYATRLEAGKCGADIVRDSTEGPLTRVQKPAYQKAR